MNGWLTVYSWIHHLLDYNWYLLLILQCGKIWLLWQHCQIFLKKTVSEQIVGHIAVQLCCFNASICRYLCHIKCNLLHFFNVISWMNNVISMKLMRPLQAWTRLSSCKVTRTRRSTRRRLTWLNTTLAWRRKTPTWHHKWTRVRASSSSSSRKDPWRASSSNCTYCPARDSGLGWP